jgi:hypothetical protein
VKILYIAGSGRCGSTLVARLLGEIEGFTNVGEASRYMFNNKMSSRGLPCSCGASVAECDFWSEIISQVPEDEREFATRAVRIRYLPLLASKTKPRKLQERMERLVEATRDIYAALQHREGSRVMVDSSKNPANAYILSQIPGVRLFVLHLVRDPRKVAASWRKPKGYLRGHSPLRVTSWWWTYNLASERLRKYADGYQRIRYEDFVRTPGETLSKVLELVSEAGELAFLDGDRAVIGTQHMLAGNPDRSDTGQVTISEPPRPMNAALRLGVSALALPMLLRYRYPLLHPAT